jgi:hypothetical protein
MSLSALMGGGQPMQPGQPGQQPGMMGGISPQAYQLLGAAQGASQFAGPQSRPVSTGQVLGGLAAGAFQGAQMGRQQQLQELTLTQKMEGQLRKAQEAKALEAAIGQLPPDQQALARVNPRGITMPKPAEPPSSVQEYEYAKRQGFQGSFQDWTTQRASAGATKITMPAEDSFGRGIGGETARALEAGRASATTAEGTIRAAQRVQDLLDSGAITGTLAGGRVAFERALSGLGLIDGSRVTNTEQLMSTLAESVLARTADMSGVLTDRDIEFLRDAAGGRIDWTEATIRKAAQLSERGGARVIERYNRLAEPLASDAKVPEVTRRLYSPLQVPTRENKATTNLSPAEQAELDELRRRFGR